jgi:hypothetical protein
LHPPRTVSGVDPYDRLATQYPDELHAFVRDLKANGWIVKPTTKIDGSTPAYFFPRKGRFYYDPERMTYLDMLHERNHLETLIERGNWKLGKGNALLFQDEITAYSHELDLLRQAGGADPKYIQYLEGRVEFYRGMQRGEGPSRLRPSIMPDPFFPQ